MPGFALLVCALGVGSACNNQKDGLPQDGDSPAGGASAGGQGTEQSVTGGTGADSGTGGAASGGAQDTGTGGATAAGGTSGELDVVTRTTSTYSFRHFPIEINDQGVWDGPAIPSQESVVETYDTVILENRYLRVTLLPDYGGRILSIIHKPSGLELLYQNPVGTPYLMGEDIFYYNYLMILGGIFPSFPEPEHGRYWNLPYEFTVVAESDEHITVRMSRQDNLDLVDGVPERYTIGRTDVLVNVDVTLRAGSTSLKVDTTLTNTKSSPVDEFEYWTVTTLAPGSVPGQTAIPLDTRIIAQMDQVHCLESSWAWFGEAEERVSGEIFQWNNLSHFDNWVDQGTAFANPQYQTAWSGLINYESDVGILRASANVETPGLKLWTFGRDSVGIDVNDSEQWLRPTIEMWHGITPEFWARGTMNAGEVRSWSDHYFPVFGLREITSASESGALYLSTSVSGTDTVLSAVSTLTLPDQTVHATLRLDGDVISEQDVVVVRDGPISLEVTLATSAITPGAIFEAEFVQGTSQLLSGQMLLQ